MAIGFIPTDRAINDTFHKNVGFAEAKAGACADGVATIAVAVGAQPHFCFALLLFHCIPKWYR